MTFIHSARKAIAAFLIPVVPAAIFAINSDGSQESLIGLGVAVLCGLGVYAIPNDGA